jgi:hypothetical protein
MYRRDYIATGSPGNPPGSPNTAMTPAPYAQVIVIGVQSRNNPTYLNATTSTPSSTDVPTTPSPGMLIPQYYSGVAINPPSAANPFSTITFGTSPPPHVAEGSYVIVSYDYRTGSYNGRIYRVGINVSGSTWEFLPGEGMSPTDVALPTADVFLVGPGCDCGNTAPRGASEAISAYSTFVSIPN